MNPQNPPMAEVRDSWLSAFADGEAAPDECAAEWPVTAHEPWYYYTLMRQVIRGEAIATRHDGSLQRQRIQWVTFWARIDTI